MADDKQTQQLALEEATPELVPSTALAQESQNRQVLIVKEIIKMIENFSKSHDYLLWVIKIMYRWCFPQLAKLSIYPDPYH